MDITRDDSGTNNTNSKSGLAGYGLMASALHRNLETSSFTHPRHCSGRNDFLGLSSMD